MSGPGGAELARVVRLRRGGLRRARRRLASAGRVLVRAMALLALPALSLWVVAWAGHVHADASSDPVETVADDLVETPDGAFALEPASGVCVAPVARAAAPPPAAAPGPARGEAAPDLSRFDSY